MPLGFLSSSNTSQINFFYLLLSQTQAFCYSNNNRIRHKPVNNLPCPARPHTWDGFFFSWQKELCHVDFRKCFFPALVLLYLACLIPPLTSLFQFPSLASILSLLCFLSASPMTSWSLPACYLSMPRRCLLDKMPVFPLALSLMLACCLCLMAFLPSCLTILQLGNPSQVLMFNCLPLSEQENALGWPVWGNGRCSIKPFVFLT
jgi:hypothetical protein